MKRSGGIESRWQYPLALLVSVILLILSVDNLVVDWAPVGEIGDFIRQVLVITATSVFSATLIHYLFQAKSMQIIEDSLTKPQTVLARLPINKFDQFVLQYIKDNFSLPEEAAAAFWIFLKEKIFTKREHRLDYERTIRIQERRDQDKYHTFRIETDYEIRNTQRKLFQFACHLGPRTSQLIHDDLYEVSWVFIPAIGECILPKDAFLVDTLEIGGDKVQVKAIEKTDTKIVYQADVSQIILEGKRIRYVLQIKQSGISGFVSDSITKIARDYQVTLDYSNAKHVQNVFANDYLLATKGSRVIEVDRRITVKGDGWVLPRSGTIFSWDMATSDTNTSLTDSL